MNFLSNKLKSVSVGGINSNCFKILTNWFLVTYPILVISKSSNWGFKCNRLVAMTFLKPLSNCCKLDYYSGVNSSAECFIGSNTVFYIWATLVKGFFYNSLMVKTLSISSQKSIHFILSSLPPLGSTL